MNRKRTLMSMIVIYVSLAFLLSVLSTRPQFYGLSIVLGITITTPEALSMGQLAISLIAIGMLVYLELSDPSYGKTHRLINELRKSWLPLSVVLILLFALIVFFRIWAILA